MEIMESNMAAIELTGTVDEQHRLTLDDELPISGPKRVRVIVLYRQHGETGDAGDADESEWLAAAARNPAFKYLHDPSEDIYSLADGKPFDDKA